MTLELNFDCWQIICYNLDPRSFYFLRMTNRHLRRIHNVVSQYLLKDMTRHCEECDTPSMSLYKLRNGWKHGVYYLEDRNGCKGPWREIIIQKYWCGIKYFYERDDMYRYRHIIYRDTLDKDLKLTKIKMTLYDKQNPEPPQDYNAFSSKEEFNRVINSGKWDDRKKIISEQA